MKEKMVIRFSARRTFFTVVSTLICFVLLVSIIFNKTNLYLVLSAAVLFVLLVPLLCYSLFLITYRLEYDQGNICCKTLTWEKCIHISDVQHVIGLSRLKKRDVILKTNENIEIPMPKFDEKSVVIIGDIYKIKKF